MPVGKLTERKLTMDPDRCDEEMIEAILAGDKRRAMELAEILADWCGKGGFPPQVIPSKRRLKNGIVTEPIWSWKKMPTYPCGWKVYPTSRYIENNDIRNYFETEAEAKAEANRRNSRETEQCNSS
jgi:hypothetical protein